MKNSLIKNIAVIVLIVSSGAQIISASEKLNNEKLDQALRKFQGCSSCAAITALQNNGYPLKSKDKTTQLSPKILKKNGQTKALYPLANADAGELSDGE